MKFIYLLFTLFLLGCVQPGLNLHDFLATPQIDQSIISVEYCKTKYNFNPLASRHSMQDEIQTSNHAQAECQKIYNHIRIQGVSPKCDSKDNAIFTNSKRLSENDYSIGCSGVYPMEIQKNGYYCWAACVQYLIEANNKIKLPQDDIVKNVKKEIPKIDTQCAANIVEIVNALGFRGLSWTKSGSWQLLSSLANNHPVMIGIDSKDNEEGHAVVILAARYSFSDSASPSCFTCGRFAFSEFKVYDPQDGKIHDVPAETYDNRISFVMSFR